MKKQAKKIKDTGKIDSKKITKDLIYKGIDRRLTSWGAAANSIFFYQPYIIINPKGK